MTCSFKTSLSLWVLKKNRMILCVRYHCEINRTMIVDYCASYPAASCDDRNKPYITVMNDQPWKLYKISYYRTFIWLTSCPSKYFFFPLLHIKSLERYNHRSPLPLVYLVPLKFSENRRVSFVLCE